MQMQKTITLNPGEEKSVAFQVAAPSQPGAYQVSVDGLSGIFTVLEPPVAQFVVSDLVISPTEVYPGEVVTISVLARNIGQVAGTATITLEVN